MQKSKKWRIFILSTLATSFFAIQTAEASTYTVKSGDTLSKIAKEQKVAVTDIKKWNKLSTDLIYVNQKLQVAANSNSSSDASNGQVTKPQTPNVVTHTVGKGDTLSKIAQKYNSTIAAIKEINQLKSDTIFIGQKLKITTKSSSNPSNPIDDNTSLPIHNDYESALKNVITKNPTFAGQAIYDKTIEVANQLVGTPYVYGGNTANGLDCSGFIFYTFNQAGIKISRDSSEGYFFGNTTKVANPVAGDLVFFEKTYKDGISHMGIYLGNNKFIHAGTDGVEISDVTYQYWASKLVAYKRFNDISSY